MKRAFPLSSLNYPSIGTIILVGPRTFCSVMEHGFQMTFNNVPYGKTQSAQLEKNLQIFLHLQYHLWMLRSYAFTWLKEIWGSPSSPSLQKGPPAGEICSVFKSSHFLMSLGIISKIYFHAKKKINKSVSSLLMPTGRVRVVQGVISSRHYSTSLVHYSLDE